MSRKLTEEQYRKTKSYHLKQWLDGSKDPYLDTVEMKPQKEYRENREIIEERKEEKKRVFERVYDI